jgi:hypothetical protein
LAENEPSEDEVLAVLVKIRDLRLWTLQVGIDPWATRQALLIMLELDTTAALERGVEAQNLVNFDTSVKQDIQSWISKSAKME